MTLDEIRKHAHDWLIANELQDGSRVQWMRVPVGMVGRWIERADVAENAGVTLSLKLGAMERALGLVMNGHCDGEAMSWTPNENVITCACGYTYEWSKEGAR